jgi:ADP-heptose:LPS heptosyltransferase
LIRAWIHRTEHWLRKVLRGGNQQDTFRGVYIDSIEKKIVLSQNARILLLRQDRIGDVLISTPLLDCIRRQMPKAQIDIVLGKSNSILKEMLSGWIDTTYVYNKSPLDTMFLLLQLRRQNYDLVIDLMDNPSTTSSYFVRWCGAKNALGILKENAHYYTHCVPAANRQKIHIVDRLSLLLLGLGINPAQQDLRLHYPLDKELRHNIADRLLSVLPNAQNSIIAINYAGNSPTRELSPEQCIQAIQGFQQLCQDKPVSFMLFGQKEYQPALQHIAEQTGSIIAPFTATFNEYAAMLSYSSIIISPDTSAVHLAAAFSIPCLCLFHQHGGLKHWTPYKSPHVAVITNSEWIKDIQPEKIITGFSSLLEFAPLKPVTKE